MEKCDCCCIIKKKCKTPKLSYQKQVDCCLPRYGTILGAMHHNNATKSKCCGEMGPNEIHIKKQKCSVNAPDRHGNKLMLALSCDKFNKKVNDPCIENTKRACCGPKPCNEPRGNYCPPAPCCESKNENDHERKKCPMKQNGHHLRAGGDQSAARGHHGREYMICMPKCLPKNHPPVRDCGPPCYPSEEHIRHENGEHQGHIGRKLVVCMPCDQELPMGNVKVFLPSDNEPAQKQPKRVKDYAYRCESRELLGSKLLSYCECVKRNGLQDQCPRTPCRGRPACLVKPWPDCWPSGGCYGQDYDRPKGFERVNPALEYRMDNKVCPPKDAVPDVRVVVQHC